MRVLVCGGRWFIGREMLCHFLDKIDAERGIDTIIEGEARGADQLAASWALSRKKELLPFIADWEKHGNAAGPIRNKEMLEVGKPDLVVAFPGGSGTANMVSLAEKAGVEVIQITAADNVENVGI